jgi:hypothetical protein
MRRMLAAGMAAAPLALAAVVPATSSAASIQFFQTPSHNIGCAYTPASGDSSVMLRCDVTNVDHPAKRPSSCQQSYGRAFGLYGTGKAKRLCVGDTARNPSSRVLGYGTTRKYGPFTCRSLTSSLRCHNNYGHGFTLSKQKQTLY